ncbi:MAG: EAL domain-containing protein [Hyphomicrobiales bacterium]|nr:EAL domain-containing protein [Hyphomicrobiales bacterium]
MAISTFSTGNKVKIDRKSIEKALVLPQTLDSICLLQMVERGNTTEALDLVADSLKGGLGHGARVIISLLPTTADIEPIYSREGNERDTRYLRDIDFSGAEEWEELRRLRIDGTGAQPLANSGRGAPFLRAIAAGLKEAFRIDVRSETLGAAQGSISAFLPDNVDKVERVAPLMRAAGQTVELLVSLRRLMRRASESDTRFAELASTLPGVVYQRVVSPEGQIRYSYISDNAFELFGVTAEAILTDPEALFAHYGKEYRETFRQKLIQASKDMILWDVEATIQRPDGEVRYTHAIARPRRELDGSVVWTGVILDATRIKLAEMAAAEAETRTREAIVESLSQGMLLFDQDDRLVLHNSHFIKLYPQLAEVAQKGVSYHELLRYELASDLTRDAGIIAGTSELRDRLARHGESHLFYERELAGERHLLINEYRTPNNATVVLYTDITELKQRERKIEHLAHHDALTGLPNRVLFHERLAEAMDRARKRGDEVAVICLDLDRFKAVNDTLGHHFGDALLQEVAKRIRSVLGENDTACRLGGDEFAVICPHLTDPEQATSIAWRLLDVLAQPHLIKGQAVMGGTSIGIAISGRDGLQPDMLLKNADLALYRAKSDGRGTFRFFEQEMDLKAQARRMMELALRMAIARNELELHYQPLVDSKTSQIMGAEALLRWNMAGQGYISPSEFVPLAEDSGLISEIGRWVLAKACAEAVRWDKDIRIAVNLSPAQLRNSDFVDFVRETLERTGLAPRRLELEVTEGMLLQNTEANTRMLLELKQLGVRISMDDFGTGYSSLGNLRSFPFDKIKIDKSFISDLTTRPESAAIIRAILTLGRSLGMTTTAEGVETRDQLAYLRAEGCMEVQGFYFAKALSNDRFQQLLKSQSGAASNLRKKSLWS